LDGAEQIGSDTTGFLHMPAGDFDGFAEAEVIRPFDRLNHIKQNINRPLIEDSTHYESGDRVRHKKFGEGLVLDVDERTITVMFDEAGRKKLARGVAPLEKMG
jgi:DNA helicase-2/ATP-dependent DNA helicase PcrA